MVHILSRPSYYGYTINESVCIAYIVLFGISAILHLGQSIYHKLWWLAPTMVLCAIGELLGWIGRYWSYQNPGNLNAFLMQICCTIFSPSFLTAGLFFTLGTLISRLGPQYVRLSAKAFSILFICCDFLALLVQVLGGAKASLAFQDNKDPSKGSHVMLVGIIIQIVAISLFVITAAELLIRYSLDRPVRHKFDPAVYPGGMPRRGRMSSNIKQMLLGMALSTALLYVRCFYRVAELGEGWQSPIFKNQDLFNYLDALPIVLSLILLNIFNPGRLLFGKAKQRDEEESDEKQYASA